MKICIMVFLSFLVLIAPAFANSVQTEYFVTQTGGGDKNGTTLNDSWSISQFNNSTNWSSVDNLNKIDPGDIVYFYGTINQKLIPRKSGLETNGTINYITIDGANATLDYNDGYWGGGLITIDGIDYIRIINFKINGNIDPPNTSSQAAIYIKSHSVNDPVEHIVIDNNEITKTVNGIWYYGNIDKLKITRNYFHDLNGSGIRGGNYENCYPDYLTIGGSKGMGNTFVNVGYLDSYYNTDAFIHIDQTSNVVVSRNIGYSTKNGWGMAGIYGNEITNALVEYNIFYDFNADHHRSPVTFKGDQIKCQPYGPLIIRFNNLWGSYGDKECWSDTRGAISVSGNWENVYAYGNNLHDSGVGIEVMLAYSPAGCGGLPIYNDNINSSQAYIFSNVIYETQHAGIRVSGMPGMSYDSLQDIFIYNNTIYRAATLDSTLGEGYGSSGSDSPFVNDSAIVMWLKGKQLVKHFYENNLIINSRPYRNDYEAMSIRSSSENFENDYNHFYDDRTNEVVVRYVEENDDAKNVTWNSTNRRGVDGDNDSAGNPFLQDVEKNDFRLTSKSTKLIDKGKDMGTGSITELEIQGVKHKINWDFALGNNTVWDALDPDKIEIDQLSRDEIGWDKGAYGFVESENSATAKVQQVKIVDIKIEYN